MTEVEYIQSSGTQYINSGVLSTNLGRIVFDCAVLATPSNWGCAFGAQGDYSGGSLSTILTWNNSRFNFRYGSGSNQIGMSSPLVLNQRYKFEGTDEVKFYVDDTLQGSTSAGSVSSLQIYLFSNHTSDGAIQHTSLKLYGCQIYDKSGTLIRDFVPALDEYSVACLYEEVSETYFYNQGSGSFTPGEPVGDLYFVQFNNGQETSTQTIAIDSPTALNANTFVKQYYSFMGWDTSSAASTVVYEDGEVVTNLTTKGQTFNLYAVWEKGCGYLLGDTDGKIYTLSNGSLSEISGATEQSLTKFFFQTNGFTGAITSGLLQQLNDPKVYCWDLNTQKGFGADVTGVPYPQEIKTVVDFSPARIIGIEALDAIYSGNVNVRYSYDDVSYTAKMSMAAFLATSLSDLYGGLGSNKKLYIKFILEDTNATLTRFKLTYERRMFA